jgi:hypothetical protein
VKCYLNFAPEDAVSKDKWIRMICLNFTYVVWFKVGADWGWAGMQTVPYLKKPASCEMLHRSLDFEGSYEHNKEPLGIIEGTKYLD